MISFLEGVLLLNPKGRLFPSYRQDIFASASTSRWDSPGKVLVSVKWLWVNFFITDATVSKVDFF